jgi:hypothetical protein
MNPITFAFEEQEAKFIEPFDSDKYSKEEKRCPRYGDLFLVVGIGVFKAQRSFTNTEYQILAERPKSKYRLRESVWTEQYGNGIVISLTADDFGSIYPVKVRFESGIEICYTYNGCQMTGQLPSLNKGKKPVRKTTVNVTQWANVYKDEWDGGYGYSFYDSEEKAKSWAAVDDAIATIPLTGKFIIEQ